MWFKIAWLIFRKDGLLELRRRESVVSMATFGVLSMLLYNFALPMDGDQARNLAPGLLWVSVTFTAILGLGKAFAVERNNDVLDSLIMAPVPKAAVFVGKLGANLVFIGLIELMMMPLFAAFFPLPPGLNWWAVGGTLALGTLGLSTLGTLFAAMTVSLRAREVIFPLLLLPLMVPVIISTAQALGQILVKDLAAAGPWIRLVGVADMIFLIASLWVFDFLLED